MKHEEREVSIIASLFFLLSSVPALSIKKARKNNKLTDAR